MKVKVAIIEFDYHAEVLRNTLHILEHPGIELMVFTSKRIWEQVNWQGEDYFELRVMDPKDSVSKFIKDELVTINLNDIVLFNTIASNYRLWADLKITSTTLLRVHNANAYFSKMFKAFKPKLTPFFIWKDTSHLIRKSVGELDWHYRKKFIDRIDHFAFPSNQITLHVKKQFQLQDNTTWTLPFGFWKETKSYPRNTSDKFKICIIGKVDQRNRDYDTVVSGMKQLIPRLKNSQKKIELILLGAAGTAYGRRITSELDDLICDVFKPVHFDRFVPQEDFDKHTSEADFLIIPTKIDTRYTIYSEKYGYTKISGSVNDVIKYHKPALIFNEYPVDDDMNEIFVSYEDASDLSDKIMEWLNTRGFEHIDFTKALASYQLKEVQKTYRSTFEQIIAIGPIH